MTLQPQLEGCADYSLRDRTRMVQSLAEFRIEWQKTVGGKSLMDVEVPIGLILADIADKLELNSQERYAMLGGKLINQVNCHLEKRFFVMLPF
jgi:hypothetical protein